MIRHRLKVGISRVRMGRGGSEARTMWALAALKRDYDVTLITSGEVDLNDLNAFYGTELRNDQFTICKASIPAILTRKSKIAALRGSLYQRFCRKIAHEFDVLISTYNFCDFGVPAIHFLADFSWDEKIRMEFDPIPKGHQAILHKNVFLRKVYLGLSNIMSNPSGRNVFSGKDLILANSAWSADKIKHKYGAESDVVYPPVTDIFPKVVPTEKEMGFVCIGRISPEKRIEQIIKILKNVRYLGHDIHLHIIGETNKTSYGKSVKELSKREGDWIILEGKQFGHDKAKLLSQHHFGIHGRLAEPFGISVAEMVKAGCITFAHNEGGQTEIINHSLLMYQSVDDAVDKINNVLCKPKLQTELRKYLERQGAKFSEKTFVNGIRKAVKGFIGNSH